MAKYVINDATLTGIANAIREKAGSTEPIRVNEMAEKVTSISQGIDTSDATVKENDMPMGVTGYAKGKKVTGNTPLIQSDAFANGLGPVWVENTGSLRVTAQQGMRYMVEAGVALNLDIEGYKLGDAEDADVTEGKTYTSASGLKRTGTKQAPVEVEQAEPAITVKQNGLITAKTVQAAGLVAGGTKTKEFQMDVQEEQIITPGTSPQYIFASKFITGRQTILGDPNLLPENIKYGVNIFGVDGSLTGGSGGADLSGSILDGSITHYSNDTIKEIKSYAFRDCNELTTLDLPAVETINSYCCYSCKNLSHLNAPLASEIGQYAFYLTNFTTLNLPAVKSLGNRAVTGSNMTTLDLGACTSLNANALYGSKALNVIVLRTPTMCALGDVNALSGTCFASGKTGGTVYVPSALIPSYQSATNWSTLYSGGTCTFAAIEGSEYE